MAYDLLLSSGYLAFARHCGFLLAVEDVELPVGAVCGTSSGALVGALWAAGLGAEDIAAELRARRPWDLLRAHGAIWRGAFRLDPVTALLRTWLPDRFDALPRALAVGVSVGGHHRLLTAGALPEAVTASCAIPYAFCPVEVDGLRCADGGATDRVGHAAWQGWRGPRASVVHLVDRSHGRDQPLPDGVPVVRSGRSGAKLWDLGDFDGQVAQTRAAALRVLAAL